MVGPVGIDDSDFRDGRIALFFLFEILLQEGDIRKVHRQAILAKEGIQFFLAESCKAFKDFRQIRLRVLLKNGCRLFKRSLSGFDRVDQCFPDLRLVFICELSLDVIDSCAGDVRALLHGRQLDALGAGIRSLIKLTGKIFHSENPFVFSRCRGVFLIEVIDLRLGKNGITGGKIILLINILNVIAVENAHAFDHIGAQRFSEVGQHAGRLNREFFSFFDKTTVDCHA